MADARELNQIAQAESAAAYEEKAQQKKDAQTNINSHVIRIGKRDPSTGKHEIIHPGGGTTISGNKTSNASVPYGSQVKTLPSSGYGTSDLTVTLGSKNRENKPQLPVEETKLKKRIPPVIPIKVLFSVIKERSQIFYVGGDRDTPQEVLRLPANRGVNAYLENTGARLDDWIFAINHWDTNVPDSFGYQGQGFTICQMISPTMPKHNWELSGLPSFLYYMGSGTWNCFLPVTPVDCIEVNPDTRVARIHSNSSRSIARWSAEYGYSNFELGLESTAGLFSYNYPVATVWDKKLNVSIGRVTTRITPSGTSLFYEDSYFLEYGVVPYLEEDKLFTIAKTTATKTYFNALISPDRKQALYTENTVSVSAVNKSTLLIQKKAAQDSQSKQILTESNVSIQDRGSRWIPNYNTLYQADKEDSSLKIFQIVPINWMAGILSLGDLDAVKKIDLTTGKGGVSVFEFVKENNQFVLRELLNKRIVVDKVKKLGYEDDPTFKMWSFNYYPEKPFE